jgi:hypothetical protein
VRVTPAIKILLKTGVMALPIIAMIITVVDTLESELTKSSSDKPINFALWALSKMKKGEILKIVDDQFTSPTPVDVLAAVIMRLASIQL